jgi:hypothetical protein
VEAHAKEAMANGPMLGAGAERSDGRGAGQAELPAASGKGEERQPPTGSPPPSPPPPLPPPPTAPAAGARSITPSRLHSTEAGGTLERQPLASAEARLWRVHIYVSQLAVSPIDHTTVGFYVQREGAPDDDDASAPLIPATKVSWLGWRHARARVEVAYDGTNLPYGVTAPIDAALVRHYKPEAAGRIGFGWGWRLVVAWAFNIALLAFAWLVVVAHILLVQRGSSDRLAACGLSVEAWLRQSGLAFAYGLAISLVVIDCTKALLATLATHPRLVHTLKGARAFRALYIMHEVVLDVLA